MMALATSPAHAILATVAQLAKRTLTIAMVKRVTNMVYALMGSTVLHAHVLKATLARSVKLRRRVPPVQTAKIAFPVEM
jgi:hypothetical protein